MLSLPLDNHEVARSDDLGEAAQELRRHWRPFRLNRLKDSGSLAFRFRLARLARMSAAVLSFGAEITAEAPPERRVTLVLPLIGTCQVRLGRHAVPVCPPAGAVVVSAGEPLLARWWPGSAVLVVELESADVERRLRDLGLSLTGPVRFQPQMDVGSGLGHELVLRVLRPLVTALDRHSDRFDDPETAAHIQDTVTTGLLLAQPHTYSAALRRR